jgi:hypothetical protein
VTYGRLATSHSPVSSARRSPIWSCIGSTRVSLARSRGTRGRQGQLAVVLPLALLLGPRLSHPARSESRTPHSSQAPTVGRLAE